MRLKVLKARLVETAVETDLRSLGSFEEPIPFYQTTVLTKETSRLDLVIIAEKWNCTIQNLDSIPSLISNKVAPHPLNAVSQFLCAAEILEKDIADSIIITFHQKLWSLVSEPKNLNHFQHEVGLTVDRSIIIMIMQAGLWGAHFQLADLKLRVTDTNLPMVHLSKEKTQILLDEIREISSLSRNEEYPDAK